MVQPYVGTMNFDITEATSLSVFQDKMGRANKSIIGYFTRQQVEFIIGLNGRHRRESSVWVKEKELLHDC